MGKNEIIYTVDDGYGEQNIREDFEGNWLELQDYIQTLKEEGCYHFSVADIFGE